MPYAICQKCGCPCHEGEDLCRGCGIEVERDLLVSDILMSLSERRFMVGIVVGAAFGTAVLELVKFAGHYLGVW